jgi:glycerol-3-phosphate acyltransferase PlsY
MSSGLDLTLWTVIGYLLGSIPFGMVLTQLAGFGDIRKVGSGNIGTTNVLRTGRKGLAAVTLLLDGGKGAAAALIAMHWSPAPLAPILAGGAAFLGHVFPVWLKFKGGKGVATFLGTLLALAWPVGLAAILIWLLTAAVTRYSSLAALVAAILSPVVAYTVTRDSALAGLTVFMLVLILIRHRDNITRLIRGEESKIGSRSG